MPKEEWKKKKYKTGKWTFKNATVGQYAPGGQRVKIKVTDGFSRSQVVIGIGQSYTLEHRSENVTLEFKAKDTPDMVNAVMHFNGDQVYQYDSHTLYIVESSSGYGLNVVTRQRLTKAQAQYA
jgi:hypothetical protein